MMTKRFYLAICICIACAMHCFAQTVSDVRFEQVNDKVKITYSLDKQADISVCVSADGGKTWSSPLKQVSGDVGKQIQPGYKTVWWDALSEYDQLVGTHLCFKVTPWSGGNLTFTVNGETFTMVYVQGGTFTMGATSEQRRDAKYHEEPIHKVILSDYYIGKYEVTQGLWKAVMEYNPSYRQERNSYPVEQVSWESCQYFIDELNDLLYDQLDGKRFALPTEAQWEYAARGGNKSKRYKYAGSNDLSSVAWYQNNSGNTTHPVGQKAPNELGLYDMSGNVWELCYDWYDFYYSNTQTDPSGPIDGVYRINRGGCFQYSAEECRVSNRAFGSPTGYFNGLGFRLVLLP